MFDNSYIMVGPLYILWGLQVSVSKLHCIYVINHNSDPYEIFRISYGSELFVFLHLI